MTDFLKKFTSIFVVDDGDNKVKKGESRKPSVTSETSSPAASSPISSDEMDAGSSGVPAVSKRMTRMLLEAMEKQNLPGFDYLEFKQALLSLKNMEMDEATRYKSVLTMSKAMGGSLEEIKASGQHYLDVLRAEYQTFQDVLQKRHKERVVAREEEVALKQKQVAAKKQMIERLKHEIAKLEGEVQNIETDIKTARTKLDSTKESFVATYQHMQNVIRNDLERINRYLTSEKK